MGEAARQRVGGYKVIRKLAVGGMAEIYLARLEAAHGFTKNVVLKRILPHLSEDPAFVDMFLHEARLAAHLSHPNIAQVFDIGEHEGRVHYTMEFVDGPELRDVARRIHAAGQPPPLDLAVGVSIGIAAGLHYAHTLRDPSGVSLQIVHRDVTPSNILLTYDGVPKLLDFGVAKANVGNRESTAVGVLKGKLPYMSPEQVDGARDIDGRSDVFSLGIVLWEMTTLRRLYRSPSQLETIKRIAHEDAPAPSTIHPDYPPKLEAIVLRALARDRNARYASALDMQRDLEDFAREAQLPVATTRLAEIMSSIYAEDLEQERLLLEAADRDRTDSQVFATRLDSSRNDIDPSEPDGSAPSLPSGVVAIASDKSVANADPSAITYAEVAADSSMSVPSSSVSSLLHDPSHPRRGPFVGLVAGLGIAVLGLGLWAMLTNEPEAAAPSATDPVTIPAADVEPEPAPEPGSDEPAPASDEDVADEPEAEPEAEADLSLEESTAKPHKRKRRSSKKSAKKRSNDAWDKNSLALPE